MVQILRSWKSQLSTHGGSFDDDDIDVDVAFYLDKEVVDRYRISSLQPEEMSSFHKGGGLTTSTKTAFSNSYTTMVRVTVHTTLNKQVSAFMLDLIRLVCCFQTTWSPRLLVILRWH